MKPSNQRCLAARVGAILLLNTVMVFAESPRCSGHGGVAGCDSKSGHVLCQDGVLDKRYPCSKSRVLKFKPATDNGQVLSPGEKAPSTTLENSNSLKKSSTTSN